ncbi:AMP-binding protein [Streptomyces sp. NPDC026206]|uniref:AMP-binding protein n=1 Tax=Streptomyces sp. NPDC026206 TaxID=3157089 RepID=UPI0033DC5A3E
MTSTALNRPVSGTPSRRPAPRGLPLTAAQSGMWNAQALDPGSPALNTAEYLDIHGDLDPVLYDDAAVAAHQRRFLDLLTRIAGSDPHRPLSALGLATDEERERVLTEFNDTAVTLPPTTLIGPVEAQAARTPDAVALIAGEIGLTYAQLSARANRLARHLAGLGLRPGTRAALALPRSPELVVALLAVLKAGGAYVLADPGAPRARLGRLLRDTAPVCVLTDTAARAAFEGATPPVVVVDDPALTAPLARHLPTDPGRALTPQHPAHVIHTPDPTGRPTAVEVPHSAVDGRLRWLQDRYRLAPGERVLHRTGAALDASVWEMLWPLREGATLVLAGPDAHRDPAALARTIREHGVSTAHFTPSALALFLREARAAHRTGLRRVLCGGEDLPRGTADLFHRLLPGTELHHLYRPAGAVGDVAHHLCEPGAPGTAVPIGRPVWNTRLYVLDTAGQPCPPGVTGELYVAGDRQALAEWCVADPFGPPGARMYPTGDLARWSEAGTVEHAGRAAACAPAGGDRPGDLGAVAHGTPASADAAAEAGPDAPGFPGERGRCA